jgi:uncharacterized protein (DUF1684 family)
MTPLDVADWRRQVFALYEQVRATPDAPAAHSRWRDGRDELFAHHAASALMEDDRHGFAGLPVADYDPVWRFELELEPAEESRFDYETGTDGIVPFQRIGLVRVPGVDFNFAYNPSCAYDPAWACPLAPVTNTVPVDVPVGELYFGKY